MKKRLLASLLALCLVFALAACGEAPAAESGEPAAASEEPAGDLVAYELDGIGTAYLPAGGEVTVTPVTEPLPQMHATIAFEGFTGHLGSSGPEAWASRRRAFSPMMRFSRARTRAVALIKSVSRNEIICPPPSLCAAVQQTGDFPLQLGPKPLQQHGEGAVGFGFPLF